MRDSTLPLARGGGRQKRVGAVIGGRLSILCAKGIPGRPIPVSRALSPGPPLPLAKIGTSQTAADPASMAAPNRVTVQGAKELAPQRGSVRAVGPRGYTATDWNPYRGQAIVDPRARAAVHIALLDDNGPPGGTFDVQGSVTW